MTKWEAEGLMAQLALTFDGVRLVDPARGCCCRPDGTVEPGQPCHALWNGEGPCQPCLGLQVLKEGGRRLRFALQGDQLCQITLRPLEVKGRPLVLELVNRFRAEDIFLSNDWSPFMADLVEYSRKLYRDPLTGAYNRRYYEERLCRLDQVQALAMLDVDHFKEINDTYGHPVGDAALRAVVRQVMGCVRSTDTVLRYGGDEFLILFPGIPREVFGRRLERIREEVSRIRLDMAPHLHITVSIGGCWDQGPAPELVRRADEQLYRAKENRDQVCLE